MKTKSKKLGETIVNISFALILIGFVSMVQPFTMILYSYGFTVILAGVILLNIGAHM